MTKVWKQHLISDEYAMENLINGQISTFAKNVGLTHWQLL